MTFEHTGIIRLSIQPNDRDRVIRYKQELIQLSVPIDFLFPII